MDQDFDFKQVPFHWELCYIAECERKAECLRYQACLQAPPAANRHPCILPTVMQQRQCPYFHPMQKMRVAVGFRYIFNKVLAKDIAEIRSEIRNYLGNKSAFYDYRKGKRPLMPRQQQWICDLFRRYGYTHEVEFDAYKDVFVYSD